MKNRILLLISIAIPAIFFSLVYFSDCDGFLEIFRTSPDIMAVSLILIPAIVSAISIIVALVLFFKIYGTPGRNGGATINQRTAALIVFWVGGFIFFMPVISDTVSHWGCRTP
ncbi:MAG TPA: hypothetical protein VGL08_12435 [Paraburkholderia sp.]|jgi:hypothetical protein